MLTPNILFANYSPTILDRCIRFTLPQISQTHVHYAVLGHILPRCQRRTPRRAELAPSSAYFIYFCADLGVLICKPVAATIGDKQRACSVESLLGKSIARRRKDEHCRIFCGSHPEG